MLSGQQHNGTIKLSNRQAMCYLVVAISLMEWTMGFTICYSFQGRRVVLEHSANRITPHDAVYYSLLHSGVPFREQRSKWVGSFSSIIEIADGYGVTDVRWHRSITFPSD